MGVRELQPIPYHPPQQLEAIETEIVTAFRRHIYLPLMADLGLGRGALSNSVDDLIRAISAAKIQFHRGVFEGKFDAQVSRELKRLGATWDRSRAVWSIPASQLTDEIRVSISASESRFTRMAQKVSERLDAITPESVASHIDLTKIFDTSIYKANQAFQKNVSKLVVAPEISAHERRAIASGYTDNMRLHIKDWTRDEVRSLRKKVEQNVFGGVRYEGLVSTIQKSYDVGLNKAKFLARQETNILMSTFSEARYKSVGLDEYRWRCVHGSPDHPVRPFHKRLDGTVQSWNKPPVVNEKGDRKHPGCDFGCRCRACPVVRF